MRATNPANKIHLLRKTTSNPLISRLHKGVQIRNCLADAIIFLPTDSASQDALVSSAQRVVVARVRTPRDAVPRLLASVC